MISREQTKAARAMLDWSQKELAERSGVSTQTVKLYETGRIDSTLDTLWAIQMAFEKAGIEFILGNGVRFREDILTVIEKEKEGENIFLRLLDDIYYTMKKQKGEILWSFVDESISPPEVIEKERLIREDGNTYRSLIRYGEKRVAYPAAEYRWLPPGYFLRNLTVVYDDKFAIVINSKEGPDIEKIIVIRDVHVSDMKRREFEIIWHYGTALDQEKPKEN